VSEVRVSLPVTANGQNFPDDSRWFGPTSSGTGPRLNFGGYLGVTLGVGGWR